MMCQLGFMYCYSITDLFTYRLLHFLGFLSVSSTASMSSASASCLPCFVFLCGCHFFNSSPELVSSPLSDASHFWLFIAFLVGAFMLLRCFELPADFCLVAVVVGALACCLTEEPLIFLNISREV